MTQPGITSPSRGLTRWWRKTHTSLMRRINPLGFHTIPFDHNLRLRVRHIDRLGRRVYLDGYSEPELAVFLHAVLRPGMTVLDVGSNFGQFSVLAARLVGNTGHVHAIDATSVMHEQTRENLALNHMTHAHAYHLALSDTEGTLELTTCVPGQEAFNSLGRPDRTDRDVAGHETVRALTLDGFCAAEKIHHVDVMKIDVEGAESRVFTGGPGLLSGDDAPVIFCEFNETAARGSDSSTDEVRSLLLGYGYKIFRFDEQQVRLVSEQPAPAGEASYNVVATKHPDGLFNKP
ncbi:FkbM family methyltransferase [Mucisphaera calidilacus]|uniref:Arsenite S-adenosylmethyltransferase n=1 Tax=Mucisphaera calidilacus TaxID=2527982 RepID=A0A518BT98_9BACT|nr:FkbM family methyltransferase [Mucisphaera calidilacus]QDU70189.1 arsenite S-adenosylmethyltransferase [Mucisphaera calidilacus]